MRTTIVNALLSAAVAAITVIFIVAMAFSYAIPDDRMVPATPDMTGEQAIELIASTQGAGWNNTPNYQQQKKKAQVKKGYKMPRQQTVNRGR